MKNRYSSGPTSPRARPAQKSGPKKRARVESLLEGPRARGPRRNTVSPRGSQHLRLSKSMEPFQHSLFRDIHGRSPHHSPPPLGCVFVHFSSSRRLFGGADGGGSLPGKNNNGKGASDLFLAFVFGGLPPTPRSPPEPRAQGIQKLQFFNSGTIFPFAFFPFCCSWWKVEQIKQHFKFSLEGCCPSGAPTKRPSAQQKISKIDENLMIFIHFV